MNDSEKLDLLLSEMQGMKQEMQGMNQEMQGMNQRIDTIDNKVANTALHIENVTDKNIQLIAENFIELTKKLNEAIPAADKNLAYEVKVNYLIEKVQTLEKEVADLKSKIA